MSLKTRYSIGEVSKLCNISRKTLRYYDTLGLLSSHRDDGNNYRYYSHDELLLIPVLKYYKQMGFSLQQISLLLQEKQADIYHLLRKVFSEKVAELDKEREALRQKSIFVKDWHSLILEAEQVILHRSTCVSVKYIESVPLLRQEQHFTGDMQDLIINLAWTRHVESLGNAITGPVIVHFSSLQKRMRGEEQDVDVLQKGILPTMPEQSIVFGGTLMASCYHIGNYETIGNTYELLMRWARENAYELGQTTYERYVSDYWTTHDTSQFVTEVLVDISRTRM